MTTDGNQSLLSTVVLNEVYYAMFVLCTCLVAFTLGLLKGKKKVLLTESDKV